MSRLNYYLTKVKRAWADGVLWQKARIFLGKSVRVPIESVIGYMKLTKADRKLSLSEGFADHRGKTAHQAANSQEIQRIIAAYKTAKRAQADAPRPFQIRGLWKEWLDVNYRNLIDALQREDAQVLTALLGNFNREQFSIGIGAGYESYLRYKNSLYARFYIKYTSCAERDILLSLDVDNANIRFPLIGNPVGIRHNGDVIQAGVCRHLYHAAEMCELLSDVSQASVVEIGAGMGGQAYQTIRLANENIRQYMIFDIPEVLVISSYFLLSALPHRKIRLFGEGPVSGNPNGAYEIGLFPHFAISELSEEADLFFNSCSFSEMDRACSLEYLRIIEKKCRRYFLHINHDITFRYLNPDGTVSENVLGSELIPDRTAFKRIFKKPHLFVPPEDRFFPYYEYLYERRR